jgi:hypothetical protein
MQCAVCQTAVGLTSALHKEHAVIHGYPRCGVCPRVFEKRFILHFVIVASQTGIGQITKTSLDR